MARTIFPAVPKNTCSINVRLSKEARAENLSLEGMVEDCERLAAQHGLRVVATHIDDGISGAIRNRPGFVAWLDDARHCRVDHLIAWHVDRMTREGINVAGQILDAVEGKDPETGRQIRRPVRLLDTKGLDSAGDETSFRFQFVIKAEVARAERERMRDRSRASRRRAILAGRWAGGGQIPFGFRVVDNPDGPGKVLAHDPREAAFIREAAERVLAGENPTAIARWANGPRGLPPRKAERWTRRTLIQVLTGFPVQGKVVTIVEGKPVQIVDEDGEPVTIDPILSPDESAAVRAKLAVKDPNAAKGGRHPSRLLSGLLRCSGCMAKLQVARRTDGSVTYRCQEAYSGSAKCLRPVAIAAVALEELITKDFLDTWGATPEYVRRAQVTGAAEVEAAEEDHMAALNEIAQGVTSERIQALQSAQERLSAAKELPQEAEVLIVPTGRTVTEAWAAGEVADRRDLLAVNYADIIVKPGRRGPRGIDPQRLTIITQPTHVLGATHDENFRRGAVALA